MKRLLLIVLLGSLADPLFAQDDQEQANRMSRISKIGATTSGDRGTFTVPAVETLNRNQLSFGFGWNNFDRTPRDLDINSVPAFISYGLTGRITVTGTFETQKQIAARNLSQPGFFTRLPFIDSRYSEGFGDTILSAKYRIQRRPDNVGGISLSGFVKLPTADETQGLGTGKVDGGIDLLFTSVLPLGFLLHSSMGLVATSDPEVPVPVGLKDEMRSGIGVAWPSAGIQLPGNERFIQAIFEYTTVTFIGAGSVNDVIQSPSDLTIGFRYSSLGQGLAINTGYRRNSNFDLDFPSNTESDGFIFGVTYTQPVEPILTNNFPLVVLEAPSDEVASGDSLEITATAFDADGDDLTYTWNTTGGQVVGTGDTVTFDPSGLGPGPYTVRVVVSDGQGGTSQAEVVVTVTQ